MNRKNMAGLALAVTLLIGSAGFAFSQDTGSGNVTAPSNSVAPSSAGTIAWPVLSGDVQGLGVAEVLGDTNRNPYRIYTYLKQARLGVSGSVYGWDYKMSLAFGGEEVPNSANSVFSLLDAYINVPLMDNLKLKVGQFKVPYSRENLSDPIAMQFADYSINNLAFALGRDVGIAFYGNIGDFKAALGTFTGGGIDVPQRYLPQRLGVPMVVLRFGYDNLDKDMFNVKQLDLDVKGTHLSAYFKIMYEKDSEVGHSSSMMAKGTAQPDVSLFYNKNWNPFLRAAPGSTSSWGELMQYGGDFAFSTDLDIFKINASAELNYGSFWNVYGKMTLVGGVAQASIYMAPFEIAVRAAMIIPDTNMGYYTTNAGGTVWTLAADSTPIYEITPAINIYLNKQNIKITMDMPIYLNTLLAWDYDGPYNVMVQPSQTTVITRYPPAPGNGLSRANVLEARMLLQLAF